MGISAEALKIMSCFKVELIIILRFNQKIKKKYELTFLFTTIYNNENEG